MVFWVVIGLCTISTICVVLGSRETMGFAHIWGWGACIPAVLIWLVQWLVVWCTIKDASAIYDFYKDLAKCRETNRAKNGEIVESYRHLREHGNALSIVVLEIVLGAALIRVAGVAPDDTKVPLLALVLAVWVLPGALVWLMGTLIELRFSEDPGYLKP